MPNQPNSTPVGVTGLRATKVDVPVVSLHSIQRQVDDIHDGDKVLAISAAYRAVLSPCEWEWSQGESMLMARYVLWAHQRLCAIDQCVNGQLEHEEGGDQR